MDIIKEIVLDTIEAFLLLRVFSFLYNKKGFILKNKVRSIIFIVLFVVVNFWSTTNIPFIFHTLILIAYTIILLKFITKISFFQSAVAYSMFFSIIIITEMFVSFLSMIVLKMNLSEIMGNQKILNTIFPILCKMSQILIVLLLPKLKISFNIPELYQKEKYTISYLILEIGVFSFFIFCINFDIFDMKNKELYNIIIIFIFCIFVILQIKNLIEREKFIEIKNHYTTQETQIKNMEEIISIIRQEKHDFANHINVIQALCCLDRANTVERIKQYLSALSNELHSSFKYLNTGNDYIDAILSLKSNYAVKKNIQFDVLINEPFSTLNINQSELISIISNLVDNAFEALITKKLENKKISFITYLKDNQFCIEISNNGDIIPLISVVKIFDKGFSTKISQGNDHGYGLFITKQFVEQNNGLITVKSTEERTTFFVRFKLKRV
ncbi:MAG: ATP-binding protein [Bacillota bacterium]|nr:ATP-binding protein [Bacillota bacterium]